MRSEERKSGLAIITFYEEYSFEVQKAHFSEGNSALFNRVRGTNQARKGRTSSF